MTTLTLPTIHLNGTSARALYEDTLEAASAIDDALRKLCAAAPNARDYYVQGAAAFPAAEREHENRLERLRSVYRELQQIAEHLCDHGALS